MKAVILAAGLSSRIRSATNGLPKCLLRFGDRTILDFQIESLFQAGVEELALVVGYEKEQIIHHVTRRHSEKRGRIQFITNPEFAATNNIYSLWLARDWLQGTKFLCLNADVLYHPDILLPAAATRADISVVIDRDYRQETTKVIIRNGRVLALSKSISRQDYSGTFIGISTFSRKGGEQFLAKVGSEIAQGHVDNFFNDVIGYFSAEGVKVSFTETAGLPWEEIDDPKDLLFAQTQVYPRLASADFSATPSAPCVERRASLALAP